MEELERRLSLDMVQDMLRDWLAVNEQAGALFDSMPTPAQRWAVDNGGGFEMLVPVVAVMKPEAREVARSFILDGLDTLEWVSENEERLSQAVAIVGNERSTGPSDGAEMDTTASEDMARVIRALLTENDELRTTLRMIRAGAAGALAFDGGEQEPSDRWRQARVLADGVLDG